MSCRICGYQNYDEWEYKEFSNELLDHAICEQCLITAVTKNLINVSNIRLKLYCVEAIQLIGFSIAEREFAYNYSPFMSDFLIGDKEYKYVDTDNSMENIRRLSILANFAFKKSKLLSKRINEDIEENAVFILNDRFITESKMLKSKKRGVLTYDILAELSGVSIYLCTKVCKENEIERDPNRPIEIARKIRGLAKSY